MADQICYAVLCVFSYIAAGQEQTKQHLHHHQQGAQSVSTKGSSAGSQQVHVPAIQPSTGHPPSPKTVQSQLPLQNQSQKIQQTHLPQQSSPKLKTVVGKPISPKQSGATIHQPASANQHSPSQQPVTHTPLAYQSHQQPQQSQPLHKHPNLVSQPDSANAEKVKPPTIPARPKVVSSSSITSSPPSTKAPILMSNRGPPPAIPPRTSLSQRSDSVSSVSGQHQPPLQRQYSSVEPSSSGRPPQTKTFPFRSLQKHSTDAEGSKAPLE